MLGIISQPFTTRGNMQISHLDRFAIQVHNLGAAESVCRQLRASGLDLQLARITLDQTPTKSELRRLKKLPLWMREKIDAASRDDAAAWLERLYGLADPR